MMFFDCLTLDVPPAATKALSAIAATSSIVFALAKFAIANGGLIGMGPGNSEQRNFLPHPYSDFIFAIIIEEGGIVLGAFVLLLYLILCYKFVPFI
jgi:cell division protein FtsW (lipid II flippase)